MTTGRINQVTTFR